MSRSCWSCVARLGRNKPEDTSWRPGGGRHQRCGFGVPALPVAYETVCGPGCATSWLPPSLLLHHLSVRQPRKMHRHLQATFYATVQFEAGEGGKWEIERSPPSPPLRASPEKNSSVGRLHFFRPDLSDSGEGGDDATTSDTRRHQKGLSERHIKQPTTQRSYRKLYKSRKYSL